MAEDRCCRKDPCAVTISTPEPARRKRWRSPLTRERLVGLVWQIVVVGIAIAVVAWLWSNALQNLSVRRISTGFAFLGREAGMPIADAGSYSPKTPICAFMVGVVNTPASPSSASCWRPARDPDGMRGCRPTGCCRGWPWLYRVLRNLPLLLQLLFWYVLMQAFRARAAWMPIDGVFLSTGA